MKFADTHGTAWSDSIQDTNISGQLEIRSVERGICPIATSTMNELFL